MPVLPRDPGALDPTTVTSLLHHGGQAATVTEVELLDVHEVTNTHVRIRCATEPAGALPERCFVKMVPRDPDRRDQIARTGMGKREVRFYTDLAPHVALRTPRVFAAVHDPEDGAFLVLMEDLEAAGCTISDGTVGVAPDAAARALRELADLHVRYEDLDRRAAVAAWVPRAVHGSPYGVTLLRRALAHHRDRMTDDFAWLAEMYVDRCDDLQARWHDGPTTVIHGDPHIGNLFDDHGRVGFLDWGIVNLSTPMRDVSYFLTMAMDVDDRRTHERALLTEYLGARDALGGTPMSFAEAWSAHRLHAAYCVPACCQIVTFPEGITERRRRFSAAFLARAEAAVADLEARAAVAEALGEPPRALSR